MDIEQLRAICTKLPHVPEAIKWGNGAFASQKCFACKTTPRKLKNSAACNVLATAATDKKNIIMKKHFTKTCLLLLLTAIGTFAQDKPVYDEALAKKLGGNENGMKSFVLVILKTGDKEITDEKTRADIFAGHMQNIQRMANAGQLAVAGPFGKNDNNFRGLYIFDVATIEEAKLLVDSDPAVAAGLLKGEFYPWFGSAAMSEVINIHNKIIKPKP